MQGRTRLLLFIIIFTLIAPGAFTANVFVPEMDLATFFSQEGDLRTRGQFDLSFQGGYKYQGKVAFEYLNPTLETDSSPSLIFDGAQATINRLFRVVDITYWTGYYGVIGEGDYYIGHLYHPESEFEYNGYLPLIGTGLILGVRTIDERYGGKVYTYQRYGVGYLNSFDLEFNLDTNSIIFNTFLGESDMEWRAGLQFKYIGEKIGFYLTTGNLTLTSSDVLDFDNFYFLLEQRFSVGNWNFIPSIFARPQYHYNYVTRNYEPTTETNDIDFNFNLNYAPQTRKYALGTEVTVKTTSVEEFGVYVSPYVGFYTLGINWKFKVDFNVVSEVRPLVTGYLNVNASF